MTFVVDQGGDTQLGESFSMCANRCLSMRSRPVHEHHARHRIFACWHQNSTWQLHPGAVNRDFLFGKFRAFTIGRDGRIHGEQQGEANQSRKHIDG